MVAMGVGAGAVPLRYLLPCVGLWGTGPALPALPLNTFLPGFWRAAPEVVVVGVPGFFASPILAPSVHECETRSSPEGLALVVPRPTRVYE